MKIGQDLLNQAREVIKILQEAPGTDWTNKGKEAEIVATFIDRCKDLFDGSLGSMMYTHLIFLACQEPGSEILKFYNLK